MKKYCSTFEGRQTNPRAQAHDALLNASLCLLWKKHQMMPDLPEAYSRFARVAGDSVGIVSLNWDLVCELALYTADIKWSYSTDPWNSGHQASRFDQLDESFLITEAEMEERQWVRARSTTNGPSPTALMIPFETLSSDTRTVISSTLPSQVFSTRTPKQLIAFGRKRAP